MAKENSPCALKNKKVNEGHMSFKKFANNILFNRLSLKKIILKFFLKSILKIFLEEKKSNPLWKKIFDIDLKDVFFRKLNEKKQ